MCNQSNTTQGQINRVWAKSEAANGSKTISAKDIDKPTMMHTLVFPADPNAKVCCGFIGLNTKTYKFPKGEYEAILDALDDGKVVKLFGTLKSGGDTMEPVHKVIRA